MKRSAPLQRKTRLKPVNSKRRAKRQAEAFGPQADLCRTLCCAFCGAEPPSDPMHVMSRGAGGKDRGNVVPGCSHCHGNQHQLGWRCVVAVPVELTSELGAAFGLTYAQGVARGLALVAYAGVPEEPR